MSYKHEEDERHVSTGSSPYTHKHKSHESNHESSRMQGRRRVRDLRDFKEREKDDRGRHGQSYGRSTEHSYGRNRDYDQDRDRRSRRRSRSRSNERSRKRSKSKSSSPSKSRRASGFDMAPSVPGLLPNAAVPGQLLGAPQTMLQNMLPFGMGQVNQLGALSMMPFQAMTQQATRHARRVYVGGLPPLANEQTIATFFSGIMAAIGGNSAGTGDAVVNVYINHEKKFAFVEMRTVEEASNAMALDGIVFEGVAVRVRRPTDYNPSLAAALGPSQPNPQLNLSVVGLSAGTIGGIEGPDRLFVGGLPYYFSETQIRELLESFGALRGFDIVKDRDTGNSKGYGFCVYQDPAVTDIACAALNGLKMGEKTLTVRRATISSEMVNPEHDNVLIQAQQHIAFQKLAMQAGGLNFPGVGIGTIAIEETPTKVLCLSEVITAAELIDDGEYEEILEDMKEEGAKFGVLVKVIIPRPNLNGEQVSGVGKVFLEYSDATGCAKAKDSLSGRKFGGSPVTAIYYPEDKFLSGDYSA